MAVDSRRGSEDWIIPEWPAPSNVRAIVTTRAGGVSVGPYASFNLGKYVGDDPESVSQNHARLRTHLPGDPVWLKQVHGNRVVRADAVMDIQEADAAVTAKQGIVLAVQMADCLPVLLCNEAGTIIGAAHAGWRGLSSGVIENTVLAMRATDEDLVAYLGPAIGPDNFEVGAEVREAFLAHDLHADAHFRDKKNGKWLADLYGLARQRLAAVGISKVYGGSFCTVTDKNRFFSYRRDRTTGRMAALIWLNR